MHGFPVQRTVEYFTRGGKETDKHPQSKLIDCHNKGHGAHTRIARYLAENFRFDMTSLRNFVYSSQLMQSEAYGYALRDWKRLFNGPGEELCAGAIIWQLNDVYPSTSWAFVDYFIRPKPAFYNIKRAFAPISVGIERTPNTRWVDEDNPRETEVPTFEIFAHNTTAEERPCTLVLRAYDFFDGSWSDLGKYSQSRVRLLAGRNNEIAKLDRQSKWTEESLIILEASLIDQTSDEVLARYVDWPEPYRYLNWPKDTGISVRVDSLDLSLTGDEAWENKVTVVSSQPLKGVWLEPVYDGTEKDDDTEPLWDDNMFDLMPGMDINVKVKGLRGRKVHARFLYDWEVGEAQRCIL
jgi:beta-mannosidase